MRAATLPALLLSLATLARADPPAQEVRIHLVLSRAPHGTVEERERIREMEEDFLWRLEARSAGRLARDTWAAGTCLIVLEGPEARNTWSAVEPAVRAYGPRPGSFVVLRPGPKGAPEERIDLDPASTPPP